MTTYIIKQCEQFPHSENASNLMENVDSYYQITIHSCCFFPRNDKREGLHATTENIESYKTKSRKTCTTKINLTIYLCSLQSNSTQFNIDLIIWLSRYNFLFAANFCHEFISLKLYKNKLNKNLSGRLKTHHKMGLRHSYFHFVQLTKKNLIRLKMSAI